MPGKRNIDVARRILILGAGLMLGGGCSTVSMERPAELAANEAHAVSSRQGWTATQSVRFASWEAKSIDRSWTRGNDLRIRGGIVAAGFTTGYRFERDGRAVAAVDVMNDGSVWFHAGADAGARAVIAAAAAALLLLEDLRATL